MTHDLADILDRIEKSLTDFGRAGVSHLLLPGLPGSTIADHLTSRGLTPLEDLSQLYQWHNGTGGTTGALLGDLWLFPGFYFLRLEDALANYDSFVRSDRWQTQWFPVFADGGGDFYAIVCAPGAEPIESVVHFRIDQPEHPIEYRSLNAMLRTVATAYEEHVYFIADMGLDMDDNAFMALAARLNGDVPWWQDDVNL